MMHAQTLEKLVKKPIKDSYGRFIGHVIGFSLDSSGNMKGLGVDHGSSTFQEYPQDRILIDANGENIILLPEWKENVDKLRKNTLTVKKRTKAINELKTEGEIPQHVYEELKSNCENEINSLRSSYDSTIDKLTDRISQIENSRKDAEKFLGTLKVQYRTTEINDETYKSASQSTIEMMGKDENERTEILSLLIDFNNNIKTPSHNEDVIQRIPEPIPEPVMSPMPEPYAPFDTDPNSASSSDPFINNIINHANNYPDLSPDEDASHIIPKSEKTNSGWKISFIDKNSTEN